MNDPDNFLSRWSRRKRATEADSLPQEKSGEQSNDRTAPPGEQAGRSVPTDKVALPAPPEFDVTSLPPIESIDAGTDISAFMQTGVPTALRHAALRRAWTADPSIRDYIGPNENFWDAAGPDGIPGFGELDPGLDVKRMVSELFGETTPDKTEPEQHDSANVPAPFEENSEAPDDRGNTAGSTTAQSAPQQNENGAMQKQLAQERPMQKMTRRHGGAIPE
jgi:uncharacterized protein DUF3306